MVENDTLLDDLAIYIYLSPLKQQYLGWWDDQMFSANLYKLKVNYIIILLRLNLQWYFLTDMYMYMVENDPFLVNLQYCNMCDISLNMGIHG